MLNYGQIRPAADALLAVSDAGYSVVAGLLPTPALALTGAAEAGDKVTVAQINDAFPPPWELFSAYGSFRIMYALADVVGLAAN